RSRHGAPSSSSMRRMIDVAPTLRNVAYSLMFESPTMTCSRRNRSASARSEGPPRRAVFFEHAQDDRRRADLEERRVLAHVRVADDDVQPAEPLGIRPL